MNLFTSLFFERGIKVETSQVNQKETGIKFKKIRGLK
jgi:hypothetical protein